jgi:Cof subfamily protein (haloacid dehalogenase superfamily)
VEAPTDIRLIALDVDGTLAARGDEITPDTRDALHRAFDAGVHVALATGRRYRTSLRVAEVLGLPVEIVCLGGALVKDAPRRTLQAHQFGDEDFALIHELARGHGHAIVCHRDSDTHGGADFVIDADVEWNEFTRRYVELNERYADQSSGFGHHSCPDAMVIGAFGSESPLRAWHGAIEARHPHRFTPSVVPSGDHYYLELTPRDVSKWTGLCVLAERLAVPRHAICAVGDQVNDLPMLREAGMAVAMGNAADSVKDVSDWVTGACDEDGIVAVVERVLGGGP